MLEGAGRGFRKIKSRNTMNLEREKNYESFHVAASFINSRSRADTVIGGDGSYWRSMSVTLTALYRTTETKCKFWLGVVVRHLCWTSGVALFSLPL